MPLLLLLPTPSPAPTTILNYAPTTIPNYGPYLSPSPSPATTTIPYYVPTDPLLLSPPLLLFLTMPLLILCLNISLPDTKCICLL